MNHLPKFRVLCSVSTHRACMDIAWALWLSRLLQGRARYGPDSSAKQDNKHFCRIVCCWSKFLETFPYIFELYTQNLVSLNAGIDKSPEVWFHWHLTAGLWLGWECEVLSVTYFLKRYCSCLKLPLPWKVEITAIGIWWSNFTILIQYI